MSNAARTIPAKSKIFRGHYKKFPALDGNKSKTNSKPNKKPVPKDVDILVIKHKHENSAAKVSPDNNKSNNFENEETWMGKFNDTDAGKHRQNPLAVNKMRHSNGKKQGILNETSTESNKQTIKIMNVQQYTNFMEERHHILELNEKYEKRIAELEQEVARVLGEFTKLYEDNERLRRKMDTGKEPLLEPYSRVFEDRKILREAEGGYKKRIIRLEKEIIEKQQESDKFQDKLKSLQAKFKPTSQAEEKDRITRDKRSKAEIKKLRTENEALKDSLQTLESSKDKEVIKRVQKENDSLRNLIKKLELEISRKPGKIVKSTGTKKDIRNVPKDNEQHTVKFQDRPFKFDYEYLLPDSQIYD